MFLNNGNDWHSKLFLFSLFTEIFRKLCKIILTENRQYKKKSVNKKYTVQQCLTYSDSKTKCFNIYFHLQSFILILVIFLLLF